jgi:hypothetical protein
MRFVNSFSMIEFGGNYLFYLNLLMRFILCGKIPCENIVIYLNLLMRSILCGKIPCENIVIKEHNGVA